MSCHSEGFTSVVPPPELKGGVALVIMFYFFTQMTVAVNNFLALHAVNNNRSVIHNSEG